MNLTDRTVLDAQAGGLACVYCGRSWRQDGSLTPLRSNARPVPGDSVRPIGHRSLAQGQASRCDPPCAEAEAAYNSRLIGDPPAG
jgi:hypothetical protein